MAETPHSPSSLERRVLDVGAIRALGHPLRIAILDILTTHGAQTATSLSEQLGESSGSTSYHLRALARLDLIREVEGRGTGRERWWEAPRGALTIGDDATLRTPAGLAATQLTVTELYRQRNERFMRELEAGMRKPPEEWSAHLTFAQLRLTKQQYDDLVATVQGAIDDAAERFRAQEIGDGVDAYSVRLDVMPVTTNREGR